MDKLKFDKERDKKGRFKEGNKISVGNAGNPLLKSNRKLTSEVRNLLLIAIKEGLEGDDKKYKQELTLRLGGSALPKVLQGPGDDGELTIKVINYGSSNPLPIPTPPISAPSTSDPQEIPCNSMA